MIAQEIVNNHIIYGTWSDVHDDQFMVYYHPNGIDCLVFILGGADYGGGICYYFECKASMIDVIVTQENKSESRIKEEIEALPNAVDARKKSGIM